MQRTRGFTNLGLVYQALIQRVSLEKGPEKILGKSAKEQRYKLCSDGHRSKVVKE